MGCMNKWIKVLGPLFVCVLTVIGCGRREMARLDDIESYVQARPDSALAQLRALDPHSLRSRRARARHSLLHAMALDKCYIDVTSDSIIAPAARYYRRHGSADEKMKALYYEGVVHQYRGEFSKAAVLFSRAEEWVSKCKDKHAAAIMFLSFSNVYNSVFNFDKQREYIEKALEILSGSGDPLYGRALGQLAVPYQARREWAKADSLYRSGLAASDGNPYMMQYIISNYGRMKVLQEDPDPEGAMILFNRKVTELGQPLSLREAGAYAYAAVLLGDSSTAESIIDRISSREGNDRVAVLPWLYRISAWKGDYESAYKYLSEAMLAEESDIHETLSESVAQELNNYSRMQLEEKSASLKTAISLAVLLLALLLFALSGLFVRRRRMEEEISRLLQIQDDLGKRLKSDALLYEKDLSAKSHALSNKKYENKMLSGKLRDLRFQLDKERLSRFRDIGYNEYLLWMNEQSRFSPAEVMSKLRRNMSLVLSPESDHETLMKRIDGELDGLASSLKEDLGLKDPVDIQFLCYWILDLKTDMISELLKVNASKVYQKRHRMKERVTALNNERYACLLE